MQSQREYLRQRFKFDEWGVRDADERATVHDLRLTGDELPGWRLGRLQRLENPDWPVHLQSIWQRSSDSPAAQLSVDIYECSSASTAREFLLRLLEEFQSPQIEWAQDNPIGDVVFVHPGDTVILAARANLVILVRNVGPQVVSVTPFLLSLNHYLSQLGS